MKKNTYEVWKQNAEFFAALAVKSYTVLERSVVFAPPKPIYSGETLQEWEVDYEVAVRGAVVKQNSIRAMHSSSLHAQVRSVLKAVAGLPLCVGVRSGSNFREGLKLFTADMRQEVRAQDQRWGTFEVGSWSSSSKGCVLILEDCSGVESLRASTCGGFATAKGNICEACKKMKKSGTVPKREARLDAVVKACAAGVAPSPFKPNSSLHNCEAQLRIRQQSAAIQKLKRKLTPEEEVVMRDECVTFKPGPQATTLRKIMEYVYQNHFGELEGKLGKGSSSSVSGVNLGKGTSSSVLMQCLRENDLKYQENGHRLGFRHHPALLQWALARFARDGLSRWESWRRVLVGLPSAKYLQRLSAYFPAKTGYDVNVLKAWDKKADLLGHPRRTWGRCGMLCSDAMVAREGIVMDPHSGDIVGIHMEGADVVEAGILHGSTM